ncbi:MAG: efflux RND transporter permease subunit [Thermaerobacter sp.]|nr:efflux RND transporter permease subunit [Thermaerobacter sp.]
MNLTRLAIRRPIAMLMVIVTLSLLGVVAYLHLPVRRFPNVNFPFVEVVVDYPGAAPNDVMNTVADPLENALAGVPGLSTMTATSFTGKVRISLAFSSSSNINTDAANVTNALQTVTADLPAGASQPAIIKANPSALPILNVALSGPSPAAISQWASNVLIPRLEEVPGVAKVAEAGQTLPEIQVSVHPSLLAGYSVPLVQIAQSLGNQNQSAPAGYLTNGPTADQVETMARFTGLGQLRRANVAAAGQAPIPLQALGTATASSPAPTTIASLNGGAAVVLGIQEQANANTLTVDQSLHQAIAALSSHLPAGDHLAITSDTSTYTQAALASTRTDLALAIFLAGFVLLMFLHRLRQTIIVMLAIPTSLLAAFLVMWLLGFSIDLISLMALSLVIGFLVDDSIVVLENIHRHRSQGKLPADAAYDGRMEIGAAAVAITLTDVVVYLPMALVSGNVGAMFREFGLTIVAATLFSLFVSFTLTPMLAAHWVPVQERMGSAWAVRWERGFVRWQERYARAVRWMIAHQAVAVAAVAAALVTTWLFIPLGLVSTSFIPAEDTGLFTIDATMPPSTSLSTTYQALSTLQRQLQKIPGVVSVVTEAGTNGQPAAGTLDVQLTTHGPRPSIFAIEATARQDAARIANLKITTATQNPLTPGTKAPITVSILGPSLGTVEQLAAAVATRLDAIPHLTEIANTAPVGSPQLLINVHHQAAAQLGVSIPSIIATVDAAVTGQVVSIYRPGSAFTQENIVLAMAPPVTPARIMSLEVPGSAGPVALSAVAAVGYGTAPTLIQQQNRLYADSVTANIAGQYPLGSAVKRIKTALARMPVPGGYEVQYGGQVRQQRQAFVPLFQALAVSVLLVYMLMAALYESFVLPLVVMTVVPLSSIGALAALALTHQTINIFSIIGLIMLMGLITKNAILLVDYTGTLRRRGYGEQAALVEAGRTRLRPIVMTSATMVLAMTPLLAPGPAATDRQAMAVVVVGGLITSTFLTLLVVPVIYSLAARWFPQALGSQHRTPAPSRPESIP